MISEFPLLHTQSHTTVHPKEEFREPPNSPWSATYCGEVSKQK